MKVLLSYPRSGNHLVRFFIEILTETPTLGITETPTFGIETNKKDVPIFQNTFPKKVPFNITFLEYYDKEKLYTKYHYINKSVQKPSELIFIVRNPNEVLLRHLDYRYIIHGLGGYESYFNSIDYFNEFDGKKIVFFYEDICTDKQEFVKKLYNFLDNKNENKLNYVLENIDELFELSKQGEARDWGGVNSDSNNYYYNKISGENKESFDNYIQTMIKTNKYNLIKEKYNL
jgi:hypothetical protein